MTKQPIDQRQTPQPNRPKQSNATEKAKATAQPKATEQLGGTEQPGHLESPTPPTAHLGPLDLSGIERLAKSMVCHLPSPLVIGLVGPLAAGKTTLVQAIARADQIDSADVTSPTFTLMQTYQGATLRLHHLDAYRLADADEFLELGVEESFEEEQSWTIVEWADRVRSVMPTETLWMEIKIDPGGHTRSIRFTAPDRPTSELIERIVTSMS